MKLNASYAAIILLLSSPLVWADGKQAQNVKPCEPKSETNVTQNMVQQSEKIVCGAISLTRAEVTAVVEKELAKHTHALKRKITVYHYGKNPTQQDGPVDPKDSSLANKYFYDPSYGSNFFDENHLYQFYTANNPLVSLDYSDDPPLLLKLDVPAGVHYLGDGPLSFSPEDRSKLKCFFDSLADSQEVGHEMINSPKYPSGLIIALRRSSKPEAINILKTVIRDLKIQVLVDGFRRNILPECAGDNPQLKFIDPSLSPLLEKTLLTPKLETNASPEKVRIYKEFLRWFEIVDASEVKAYRNNVEPKFWEYYKSIAPVIYHLPENTDWVQFQKEQSRKLKKERAKLIDGTFGCSKNPAFKEELLK